MIKKLRWRFISLAMIAFTVVVLVVLFTINFWNYQNVTRNQDNTLEMLILNRQIDKILVPPIPSNIPDPFVRFSPEFQHMMRYFSVSYAKDGRLKDVNQDFIASISRDEAVSYAEKALSGLRVNKTRGYIQGYRYRISQSGSSTDIYFLNSERELQIIQSLLFITGLVAIICLGIVFLLVYFLSHRAVAPYIRNIEAQKQFITNAGHELKTPLTAISTSADILAMDLEGNEWVENIQFQSKKMSKLIGDLITLSRLDEEQPFSRMADFSLSDTVWEVLEQFTSIAQAKGKEFHHNIEDNLSFHGDQASIQQMLSILLDNAFKYSNENGKIDLEVHKKGRNIEIEVSNTCDYCDPENIHRIFDRFYQGDASRNNRGSYGIGLSIAKAIVEKHGGTIKASCMRSNEFNITVCL